MMKYPQHTHEETLNLNQYAIKAMRKMNNKTSICWHNVLRQLKPLQHIQYLNADPGPEVDFLLEKNLLKTTKKPGCHRFIVNKDYAFFSWEPKLEFLASLSQQERDLYQAAWNRGEVQLVDTGTS